MVKISEPGPALRVEQLEAFESKVGVTLPDVYRQFLLQYNGGLPTPDVVDIEGFDGSPSDVQVFFGIGRSIDSSDLAWNLDSLTERRPGHGTVPIATDSGGNLYCIRLSEPDRFAVVYCDLNDDACPLYPVASSFADFLAKIREWED